MIWVTILLFSILNFTDTDPVIEENHLTGVDYSNDTNTWNGIGEMLTILTEEKISLIEIKKLHWNRIDPKKSTLFFLSPQTTIDKNKLSSFLYAGGHVFLVEDFRHGGNIFKSLGLELKEEEYPYPQAVSPSSNHSLSIGLHSLQLNHPASFDISQTPIWAFPDSSRALFAILNFGKGKLYLLSDPSIFINNMIHREDNEPFIIRLMKLLSNNRQIFLLRKFSQHGWPGNLKPGDNRANLNTKEFIRGILAAFTVYFKNNSMGIKIISLLLLLPFIYFILLFAGTQTLSKITPPPLFTMGNIHQNKLRRAFAVRDILVEKLKSNGIDEPLLKTNKLEIQKKCNLLWGNKISKSILNLLPFLYIIDVNNNKISKNFQNYDDLILKIENLLCDIDNYT
jgi:Domain of unknown function (DUF4350)